MDRGPSFRIWTASLIHLVDRSDSLSITDAADQLITWFSWTAWSVSADLLDSADEIERWLLVKARFVFDSTSDLYSCNLTPSFLPVSQCRSSQSWHTEPYTHILLSVLCPHDLWIKEAVHIRKEGPRSMNRDEGSYQLSHTYDRFLGSTLTNRAKNRKKKT